MSLYERIWVIQKSGRVVYHNNSHRWGLGYMVITIFLIFIGCRGYINTDWLNYSTVFSHLTPGLQIKNNKVLINKKVGDGASSDYNLEVNGIMYATNIISPGTLDLSTSSNGIQFGASKSGSVPYFVTNIEAGSKDVTLAGKNGTEAYVDVTYHNGSKGGGTWYIVATAHGSYSDNVSVGISYESTTGFRIWVRNVYAASSRTLTINWIAVKYS